MRGQNADAAHVAGKARYAGSAASFTELASGGQLLDDGERTDGPATGAHGNDGVEHMLVRRHMEDADFDPQQGQDGGHGVRFEEHSP